MMMPLPCWENYYHHPAIMIRVRKKVSFIFLLLLFFSILHPPHLWQVDRWNINKLKIKTQFIQKKKAPYQTGGKYPYLQRIFIQHIQNGILLFAPNQIDLVENCKNQLFTIFLFFLSLNIFFSSAQHVMHSIFSFRWKNWPDRFGQNPLIQLMTLSLSVSHAHEKCIGIHYF